MISPESAKDASRSAIDNLGLPFSPSLPVLEGPENLSPQTSENVARRAVVLTYVVGIGFGQSGKRLLDSISGYSLIKFVSSKELYLLSRRDISEQEMIDSQWLVECLQAFAWCFGQADLDPLAPCSDDLASKFPSPFTDPSIFIAKAKLRPFSEIYQQADLHYRVHWAARESRLKGSASRVHEGVVRERRRALDWAIGIEADWDEVPGDT